MVIDPMCAGKYLAGLMKLGVLSSQLLLSITVIPSAYALTRIGDDMGGPLGKYLLMFTRLRDSGEQVIIDGNCFSACTLVTIIPKERICVTHRAVLGFHAGWVEDQTGKQSSSEEGTRLLFELYPPAIQRWITNHGGLGRRTILLRAQELLELYPLCK
jgi:hypothetical protein